MAARTTTVRLPPELLEQLTEAAADRDVGRNWLICKLLEEGLERLIPADQLRLSRDAPPEPTISIPQRYLRQNPA